MKRSELLDAWDQKIFDLLFYLNNNHQRLRKSECWKQLAMQPATFKKLCESIEELQAASQLFLFENQAHHVYLQVKPETNLDQIFYFLIKRSVKYQLIREIYGKRTPQSQALKAKLGISSATLYRKLEELNDLLQEFNLTITAKELQGPELQIRYFLFRLYLNSRPWRAIPHHLLDQQLLAKVEAFDQSLDLNLSQRKHDELVIYLTIVKKRYIQDKVNHELKREQPFFQNPMDKSQQQAFIDQLKSGPLYPKLQNLIADILRGTGKQPDPYEGCLLLLHMMGNDLIKRQSQLYPEVTALAQATQLPTFAIKQTILQIMTDHRYVRQQHPPDSERKLYGITLILWQHLIYSGYIDPFRRVESPTDQESFRTFGPYGEFIRNFFSQYFPDFSYDTGRDARFITNLLNLSLFYGQQNQAIFSVGVYFEGEYTERRWLRNSVINNINSLAIASASPLEPGRQYDLVISNVDYPAIRKQGARFFLFNYSLFTADTKEVLDYIYTLINPKPTKNLQPS